MTPFKLFGKDRWWLNKTEKEELMDVFSGPAHVGSRMTMWQYLITTFNWEYKYLPLEKSVKNLLSNKRLKYPDCLPFDLPLPDYRKLPDKG